VHALTGRPLSAMQGSRDTVDALGPGIAVALAPAERTELHAAIARRFDAMLAAGLVDEVRALRDRYPGLTTALPSMRCVGYRQTLEYLDGRGDRVLLRERGIAATRQLAKRQLTWLRSMDVTTIDCFAPDAEARVAGRVAALLDRT
jgi:tRNA dimethylallyltransferase